MFRMAAALAKEEGLSSLYAGMFTQCTKMCFYIGIGQNLYEQLRRTVRRCRAILRMHLTIA